MVIGSDPSTLNTVDKYSSLTLEGIPTAFDEDVYSNIE